MSQGNVVTLSDPVGSLTTSLLQIYCWVRRQKYVKISRKLLARAEWQLL